MEGSPTEFLKISGKLYLYAADNSNAIFHEINPSNYTVVRSIKIPLANSTPIVTLGEGSEVLVVTSPSWQDYNDAVAKVSVNTMQVINPSFYASNEIYGIWFNTEAKEVYVVDHNGFQGKG